MFYFRAMQSFHEMRSFHIDPVHEEAHGSRDSCPARYDPANGAPLTYRTLVWQLFEAALRILLRDDPTALLDNSKKGSLNPGVSPPFLIRTDAEVTLTG